MLTQRRPPNLSLNIRRKMGVTQTLILELLVLCGVATGFSLFYLIRLANRFNLLALSNERTSHVGKVPSIGGLAFFINFLIACGVSRFFGDWTTGIPLLMGAIIIVFVGVRDDMYDLSISRKLPLQVIAILAVLLMSSLKIESMYGFLYIYDIPDWIGYPLSLLLVLFFMQAYNLIDGIDGHAAGIGMVIFGSFSLFFWFIRDYFFLTLSSVALVGLIVYLWYNFSNIYKIFMGDTGTLLMGYFIGFCTIRILSYDPSSLQMLPFQGHYLPVLLMAILFVPIFDVLRVMIIRRKQGKQVFSPDRNHVHHVLTDAGLSHRRASFLSSAFSMSFAFIVYLIIQTNSLILLLLAGVLFLLFINVILLRMNRSFGARRWKVKIRRPVHKYSRTFKAIGLYNFLA